jgi:hypothetical protein
MLDRKLANPATTGMALSVWFWLCLFIVTTRALIAGDAYAQNADIETVVLPERGGKSAGFTVNMVIEEARLVGDMPVAVRVTPNGATFPADRSITVRIAPRSQTTQPPGNVCIYELPIQLTEGAPQFDQIYYLPKWTVGGRLNVSVLENRRVIEGYRAVTGGTTPNAGEAEMYWSENAGLRFGWIVEDRTQVQDARIFCGSLAPELLNINDLTTSPPGFEFARPWRQLSVMTIDTLPTDWRGFDACDVWVCTEQVLNAFMKNKSPSVKAFREYLRCGGTLWVLGPVKEGSLETLLELPPPSREKTEMATAIRQAYEPFDYEPYRATTYQAYPTSRGYLRELAMEKAAQGVMNNFTVNPSTSIDALFQANLIWLTNREIDGADDKLSATDFDVYNVAMGKVIALNRPDTLPGSPQQWRCLANLTGGDLSEATRRAVDPAFGDRRFWDWIIPDVAQPPVYSLMGLLILFAIIVGPLAYRKFTKLGRGYLMMFVAPILAILTTLMMFAYGLIADGLSTRVRVREVTWIGDHSGAAARYCRSTYFAGIRPTDGMLMPGNAILLPYQLPSVPDWYTAQFQEHSTLGTIRVDDKGINLDSGFLPSRQQKQYVTYRPVDDFGSLFLVPTDVADSPEIKSTSSIELRQGVIHDRDGNYFSFEKLASGATIRSNPITKKEASGLLSDLYAIQRPLPPPAVSSSRRAGDTTIDLIAQLDNRPLRPNGLTNRRTTGDSTVEDWLRHHLQIASELPPGTFIAVADVTPDCVAVKSAEIVESVHYVLGELR